MIKQCPKCNAEFESATRKFCSRSCANSRVFSAESLAKKSEASKKALASIKGKPRHETMSPDAYKKWRENVTKRWQEKYEETPFEKLGMENRRRRVYEEQNHTCLKCGLNEWLGEPITLELEHKDGNNKNNSRDNLEALCPNCHSLTETWRGRNKHTNRLNVVSDAELLESLNTTSSIRQALMKLGMAAKGGNYIRAKRLLGD